MPNPPPGPQMNPGILQAPIPQLPGIVRQMPGMPQQQGGMMMMQRVGPLLGPPTGFANFPPGSMPPRPPLLPQAPPIGISGSMKPVGLQPQPIPLKPSMLDDEPMSKKAKSLEDSLIPEAQFLVMHKSPTTFTVVLPSFPEKPEMNLNGQIISVTMGLNEPISLIKTKVHELIGLAPGKQKLSVDGLFSKTQIRWLTTILEIEPQFSCHSKNVVDGRSRELFRFSYSHS